MQKQQVQDIDRQIAQRIYDRRYDLGLTTTDVARKMGMSQAAYSRMELGQVVISVSRISKIAEILRTDVSILVNGHQVSPSLEATDDINELVLDHIAPPALAQTRQENDAQADLLQSGGSHLPGLTDQVTKIILAFVAKNAVTAEQLPRLIKSVREALSPTPGYGDPKREGEGEPFFPTLGISRSSARPPKNESPTVTLAPDQKIITDELTKIHARRASEEQKSIPAINPRDSIHHKFIYCLECGAPFQSLKKHLGAQHGLTPEKYRHKWGLPFDYPMSAPAYSSKRSLIAKNIHHQPLKKRSRR